MTLRVRFTREAEADLVRLYEFILDSDPADWQLAEQALEAIQHAIAGLERSPFSYRKAVGGNDPLLRELVIPFGATGYVALFEIEGDGLVTVLAVRDHREDDYYRSATSRRGQELTPLPRVKSFKSGPVVERPHPIQRFASPTA